MALAEGALCLLVSHLHGAGECLLKLFYPTPQAKGPAVPVLAVAVET